MSFIPKLNMPMVSANARECLGSLEKLKLSERNDLVQLNDQLVDIIEHVHYMEAEHAALEHDYNLLKTGLASDSTSINELFEVEIRNVKVETENITRNRQHLLGEQSNLSQQVKQAEDQWRHVAKAALGVPKEVDEDFKRICDIQAENCLTTRRIKYVEDKNRLIKQNNGKIYEQINLMKMRKDQAVSLRHEFILRKNELLNSIRTMEEDNKKVIMNEHKYFVRDRTVDRHTFRDQLRQAIADIRADYEFRRLRNEEENRTRLEREIRRLNENPTVNIVWERLRDELGIVKKNCAGLQNQVSQIEIRNASLTQQIELLRLEISENHQSFELSIDFKIKETEKLRAECTSLSLELEKLCDLNLDLQKEINKYRELLDRSGSVAPHQPASGAALISGTWDRFRNTRTETVLSTPRRIPSPSPVRYDPVPISTPLSVGGIGSTYESRTHIHSGGLIHEPTPIRREPSPIRSPYQIGSGVDIGYNIGGATEVHIPSPRPTEIPAAPSPVIPAPAPVIPVRESIVGREAAGSTSYYEESRSRQYTSSSNQSVGHVQRYDPYVPAPPPVSTIPPIPENREFQFTRYDTVAQRGSSEIGSTYRPYDSVYDGLRDYTRTATGVSHRSHTQNIGSGVQITGTQHVAGDRHVDGITERTGYGHYHGHRGAGSESTTSIYEHIRHESPAPPRQIIPQAAPPAPRYISEVENTSSSDSVDEDNFQRFTRWYKGRVKISDVTPDFIQIVNRSSKKSADIGGFKIIHEFGDNSVYVDLPVGLILAPKECFKIYARSSKFERGSVFAEIDLFDTSIHTNTSIRNTNNEVKSWFVYTSNTEIGEHHH